LGNRQIDTSEDKRFSSKKTIINISRKGSIIRERCNQLMEIAWNLGCQKEILSQDLVDLIKMYVGGNRDTIRDYLGYPGRVVHGRYGSHVIGIQREGYLQIFGYAKRGSRGTWNLHHELVPLHYHYEEILNPSKSDKETDTYEELEQKVNMEKISLSPILQGKECEKTVLEVVSLENTQSIATLHTIENNNNNNTTARERNLCILTPEAQRLLDAELGEEPDKSTPIRRVPSSE
jgi:hypothetical protein